MTTLSSKRKAPAGEPRPRGRPQKHIATEVTNPKPTPGEPTLGKDQREEVEKVAMSMTKSSSKIHESTSYDEAVNDPIQSRS